MTVVKYILSLIFRLIVYVRNFLYNSQIIKPKNLNCKVISVGNVSVGGTGKTSFTEYIASYFMRRGKFPAVISKGYGRKDKDIKVAETGFRNEQGELTSENFGDEPLMLLENLSSQEGRCLVVTGEDKTKTAKFVCSKFRPDIIIIDDGFQHRKLGRDLDIVLVTSNESRHILPYGRLREPLGNISRADLIIRNMKFTENPGGTNKPDHKTTEIKYVTDGFFNIRGEKLIAEKNTPALIFSGIADPQSFHMAAESLGVNIKNTLIFRDHHNFTSDDIRAIINRFETESAELIITTHKDFIRMKNSELALKNPSDNIYRKLLFDLPLYYLKINIQITRNYDNLEKQLELLIRLI